MSANRISRRAMLALLPAGLVACTTADQQAILNGVLGATGDGASGLTSAEAAAGIREALTNGIGAAIAQVGRQDGYFADQRIHIPLPGTLANVQSSLSRIGLSGLLDDLELKLNRGAEAAAPHARRIFVGAITSMSVEDAIGIVRGGETSATDYFKRRTTPELTRLFRPMMNDALRDAGALQAVDQIAVQVGNIPMAPDLGGNIRGQVVDHGVEKGLDGLFYYIGREEAAIRRNPAKRTSEILRKVFG